MSSGFCSSTAQAHQLDYQDTELTPFERGPSVVQVMARFTKNPYPVEFVFAAGTQRDDVRHFQPTRLVTGRPLASVTSSDERFGTQLRPDTHALRPSLQTCS